MIGVRFQLTRKRLFSLIPSFVSLFDPTGGRLQVCLAVRPVANFPAAYLAQRQRRFQSVKMQIRSELQDASGESGSQGDRTNFQREKSMGARSPLLRRNRQEAQKGNQSTRAWCWSWHRDIVKAADRAPLKYRLLTAQGRGVPLALFCIGLCPV
jgi:hypothetical protein